MHMYTYTDVYVYIYTYIHIYETCDAVSMTWGVCRAAWKGVPNSEEKDVIGDSVPLVKMIARARDDKSPKATAVCDICV